MEKRESNEQLKSLSFDMDEEIDDRNERRGRKAAPPVLAIILAGMFSFSSRTGATTTVWAASNGGEDA